MRICTITVRAGSKGVPGKNLRVVAGRPLFGHSVVQAVRSGLFDEVVVSSDSEEILALAPTFGATGVVVRPPEMATDTAGKVPAIAHAVRTTEERTGLTFDVCVDLDATSPLRTVEDIRGAVAMFGPGGMAPALVERLSKAVQAALADPNVKERIQKMGMEAKSSTPQELDAFDRAELARWGAVVKASGYVPE